MDSCTHVLYFLAGPKLLLHQSNLNCRWFPSKPCSQIEESVSRNLLAVSVGTDSSSLPLPAPMAMRKLCPFNESISRCNCRRHTEFTSCFVASDFQLGRNFWFSSLCFSGDEARDFTLPSLTYVPVEFRRPPPPRPVLMCVGIGIIALEATDWNLSISLRY